MKTKFKITIHAACHSLGKVFCAGAVMLIASVAQAQNVFVEIDKDYDYYNSIVEITPDGTQSQFASGLRYGFGMAVNNAGDLFYADDSGNVIAITPGGGQGTFAAGVSGPLAFDSAGNLFVADRSNGTIYKYTPGGVQSTFAAGVSGPLAFDSAGNLFVAANGNIYEFTPDGVQSTFASGVGLGYSFWGLAVNSAGDVFVTVGEFDSSIIEITPGGVQSNFGQSLAFPGGLALDSADNLWVVDSYGVRLDEFTPNGVQSASYGEFPSPSRIAIQPAPEPSAVGMLAVGATILFLFVRRTSIAG